MEAADGAKSKGEVMTYREDREFLDRNTTLIELSNDEGARVAVCPEWQGRVMTSTCGGLKGPSFGFINRRFIDEGRSDPKMNNYGGEERMWLSPEGGQFSLWFKPDAEQTFENWFTPPALNEAAWEVASTPNDPDCLMATSMRLSNASATEFELDVTRNVRLLGADDLRELFGEAAAKVLGTHGVRAVAYESVNQITNQGEAMTEPRGLVSIWILGMLRAGPDTVVIVPYKPGPDEELGPAVKSDYFGPVPPERLRVTAEVVLLLADGGYRAKIGTSQRRARNVLGSVDFSEGVLSVVHFSMPKDPGKHPYMNNMWGGPLAEPYCGDVANAYNDGPNESGQQLGAFYEIESLSPAAALRPGQSLVHRHRTVHVQAQPAALATLAKTVLGVELETVRREMLRR